MVGLIVLFIGLIFIIAYPYNKKKNARCSAQTQGVLAEVRERRDANDNKYNMYVYAYQVNGVGYQLSTREASPQAKNVGDNCVIWYNPKKPKDAQAYRGSDKYLKTLLYVGLALLVVGIILMIIGLI